MNAEGKTAGRTCGLMDKPTDAQGRIQVVQQRDGEKDRHADKQTEMQTNKDTVVLQSQSQSPEECLYESPSVFNNRISLLAASSASAVRPQLHTQHILLLTIQSVFSQLTDTISNGKIQQNNSKPPCFKLTLMQLFFWAQDPIFGAKHFCAPQLLTFLCLCFLTHRFNPFTICPS